jgi:galactose mutarotase-like enzyme
VTLRVIRSGSLEASFEPAYGMICASLRDGGDELLAQRKGLEEYKRSGSTMGIPLLHPWANRLGASSYTFDGEHVTVDGARLDPNGWPIHGLRAAVTGWETLSAGETRLVAGRDVRGLAGFPFDHRIEVAAELAGARLTITTTLTAFDRPVPVCFGHHPYLQLPGVPRAEWEVAAPVRERLLLDARGIPTGAREPAGSLAGALDDLFTTVPGVFSLAGGGRRIEVVFERGYPYAQLFAPGNLDAVCFEPMTAPTDALRRDPPSVAPGESYSARFAITTLAGGGSSSAL